MSTDSQEFEPYIKHNRNVKEFSFRAVFLGMIFGLLFAVANAYLGLKIGMTVSASIPSAILSMALLKMFCKRVSILEHNIVQTVSTVGEGLAAGVIFTIPALIFLGETPSIFRIFLLTALGGVLGILFMIPMRRYIIVKEHGVLPFPEGTACAELLKAGEKKGSSAIMAGWGFIVGAIYKTLSSIIYLFPESFRVHFQSLKGAALSIETTPALLGVGYIIGPNIASYMFAGGVIGWWILIPLIQEFGGQTQVFPATVPIGSLSPEEIWSNYIRYIGAGAVAIGGMFSLIKIFPLLIKTVHVGVKELFSGFKHLEEVERTDKDISMAYLVLGTVAIILFLWLFPGMPMNFFTIVLLILLGYFFSCVVSITVGLVGSSSSPMSGMTITTLLITCITFVMLGWTERSYLIAAITMSAIANLTICMAGTTSQDLKTGFLLGATPMKQQIAEIIGVLIPAFALGATVYLLNNAFVLGSENMPAPQASLMAMIAEGIISNELPYTLVFVGVVLGVVFQILKIPVLPVAIGLYLPLSISTAIMIGGLISYYVHRHTHKEKINERARLICAGLIGGDACIGVLIALLATLGVLKIGQPAMLPMISSLIAFLLLALWIAFLAKKELKKEQ